MKSLKINKWYKLAINYGYFLRKEDFSLGAVNRLKPNETIFILECDTSFYYQNYAAHENVTMIKFLYNGKVYYTFIRSGEGHRFIEL